MFDGETAARYTMTMFRRRLLLWQVLRWVQDGTGVPRYTQESCAQMSKLRQLSQSFQATNDEEKPKVEASGRKLLLNSEKGSRRRTLGS